MPQTVDGIGTWYWGKTRIFQRTDSCEHCGRDGVLRSYDTTHFFVFLYIPIIPLGRKRIIDECPVCSRHRAIPIKEWDRARVEAVDASLEALRRSPNDEEKAGDVVGASLLFQDETILDEVAAVKGETLTRSAKIRSMLATAYRYFGRTEDAEAEYRASLEIEDDPAVREAFSVLLLRQKKPDQAWEQLVHIVEQKQRNKVGFLFLVAEGYQSWGMHDEALEILDTCVETFPDVASDKEYTKLRRFSEKHRGTEKRLKSPALSTVETRPVPAREWSGMVPRLIFPVLLLILAIIYVAIAAITSRSHEVFVVNGLSRPYTVELNGHQINLGPHGVQRVTLSEGDVSVKVLDPELSVEDQQCRLETSFWTRPVSDHTFVINPDRTALLIWQEIEYVDANEESDSSYTYHYAELLTHLTGLDYVFVDMPEQIMSEHDVTKQGVQFLKDYSHYERLSVAVDQDGAHAAERLGRQMALVDPELAQAPDILAAYFDTDTVSEMLDPLLSRVPVEIEVHRYYQSAQLRVSDDPVLIESYRERLASDSENGRLLYLLGRIVPDGEESEKLFRAAIEAEPPCAYGYLGLVYRYMSQGRFEESLALGREGQAVNPEIGELETYELHALRGLRRVDELLEYAEEYYSELDSTMMDDGGVYELALFQSTGTPARADELIETQCSDLSALSEELRADMEEYCRYLRSSLAYLREDIDTYAELGFIEEEDTDYKRFQVLITQGNLHEADKTLDSIHAQGAISSWELVMAIAAGAAGDSELAEKWRVTWSESSRELGQEERVAGQWLTGENAPAKDAVLELSLDVATKCLWLTAMGQRFPAIREPCFDLARKLNFTRTFPYLLLKKVLGEVSEPAVTGGVMTFLGLRL